MGRKAQGQLSRAAGSRGKCSYWFQHGQHSQLCGILHEPWQPGLLYEPFQ